MTQFSAWLGFVFAGHSIERGGPSRDFPRLGSITVGFCIASELQDLPGDATISQLVRRGRAGLI